MLVVWASGFAADKTYSYTFKSGGSFTGDKPTQTFNGVKWTIKTDGYLGFEASSHRAQQIGKKNAPAKNTEISTSDFSGTIKSVKINGWNGQAAKANVEVFVGNVSYGTKNFTTDRTSEYLFNGTSSGALKIKITNNVTSGAVAYYIKTISVTYEEGPTKTLKSLAISGDATKKAYNDGEEFDPTGLVVTGTYDDASTAAITEGITWTKTPAKLAVGNTSCSVTATVNGVTSPAYEVTDLSVTKTISLSIVYDFTANPNVWGIAPERNNKKTGNNVVAGKELKVSGVVMTATNGDQFGTCLYGTTSATLNVYGGGSITFKAPEGFNISQIVFKGSTLTNLNASDETYTNGTWTGNVHEVTFSNKSTKVGIESATIKLVATSLDLSEAETAEETAKKLTESNGKTIDVKLARTLTAGVWNTICLPFDVTAEQIANVLKSEGNVKEYGSEDASKQTIYFKAATTMKAGVPYLIKPTEDAKELVFKGVTIKNVDAVDRMVGDKYNMCGVFGKYAMNTNGTELFLKTDGKFYVPAVGKETMKGFRAYFLVPKNTAAAALNLSFGDATGIDGVAADAEKNVKVYNVNGQYVGTSLEALPKGLYIVGGKKVLK